MKNIELFKIWRIIAVRSRAVNRTLGVLGILLLCGLCSLLPGSVDAGQAAYFIMGDGQLVFASSKRSQAITYRGEDGAYNDVGLQAINRRFKARWSEKTERIEVRLIELMDHVQDHFAGAPLVLMSGFRSRQYNQGLRNKGRLAAQSSMHIEGGAADFHLQGVNSSEVAAYVRSLQCCGVGYYHGQMVHVDVGPVRHWDEQTSGTKSQEPQRNAKIIAQTAVDRVRAGDTLSLRFMRMTQLPIVVPTRMQLECEDKRGTWRRVRWVQMSYEGSSPGLTAVLRSQQAGGSQSPKCQALDSVGAVRSGQFQAKRHRRCRGNYRLRIPFCERASEQQPAEIVSNVFTID